MSEDIRLGRITAHLLHPFPFLEFHCAQWLAFQLLQLVVVGFLLAAVIAAGLLPAPEPRQLALGLAFSSLVAALWFACNLVIGLLSFWLEQTWVLRVILKDVGVFLSGAILPLELYPEGLRAALLWTPFPYLSWVPARILSGEYTDLAFASGVTLAWTAIVAGVAGLVWQRGLRLYSAAGM
jgi:ABC-2 type transport system permease protein